MNDRGEWRVGGIIDTTGGNRIMYEMLQVKYLPMVSIGVPLKSDEENSTAPSNPSLNPFKNEGGGVLIRRLTTS